MRRQAAAPRQHSFAFSRSRLARPAVSGQDFLEGSFFSPSDRVYDRPRLKLESLRVLALLRGVRIDWLREGFGEVVLFR